MNGEPWPKPEKFHATVFFSDVLALRSGAKHVHVVAAQHGRWNLEFCPPVLE